MYGSSRPWGGRRLAAIAVLCMCAGAAPARAAGPSGAQQRALAAAAAVKIAVRGSGWVRVGQPALVAAGLPAGADPARLQLYADGIEQSIVVTGNGDATFSSDEAIEFYGVGRDTLWTDTRSYWLIAGAPGARVAQLAPPPGAAAPASFRATARLLQHTIYLASIHNGDASNFFGATIGPTAATQQIVAVRRLDPSAGDATLRVNLQGVTATEHLVDVSHGGARLGTCALSGQETASCSFDAPGIAEGDNSVTLAARGSTSDYVMVKSIEVDYQRSFTADDDVLALTAPAEATRLSIGGFSAPDVRVVDVSDPAHPVALTVSVTTQAGVSTATFDTPPAASPRALYAFTGARAALPAAVTADVPSRWGDSHDGELVILSHARFLGALAPLAARRAQQGWSVQMIDLQDVYDEYSGATRTRRPSAHSFRTPAAAGGFRRGSRCWSATLRSIHATFSASVTSSRADEAHRHGADGDRLRRLVRRRQPRRRPGDRARAASRADGRSTSLRLSASCWRTRARRTSAAAGCS